MRQLIALILSSAACGSVQTGKAPPPDGGAGDDGAPGAPDVPTPPGGDDAPSSTARCDRRQPFGAAARLDELNPLRLPSPSLTVSGDEMFAVVSEGGELRGGLRSELDGEFPEPVADEYFAAVNVGIALAAPSITGDALQIYYTGDEGFLEHAGRADLTEPFVSTGRVIVQNRNLISGGFQIASDGQTLYWIDLSDARMYAASAVEPGQFNAARAVSTMTVTSLAVAPDELKLYYGEGAEILASTRTTLQRQFEPGTAQADVSAAGTRNTPLVATADDCELYFASDRDQVNRTDIFRARRGR